MKKENPDHWANHSRKQNSIDKVIEVAALARDSQGKKHPHQWRIKNKRLINFQDNLIKIKNKIEVVADFDELYNLVSSCSIHGISEVTIYDTSLRIGEYLNKTPKMIYLHARTKEGYKLLRKIKRLDKKVISKDELPEPFSSSNLTCSELEDLLCIFKDKFTICLKL